VVGTVAYLALLWRYRADFALAELAAALPLDRLRRLPRSSKEYR
jgi:hypothetical protein